MVTEAQLSVIYSLRKEEMYIRERLEELNAEIYCLKSPSLEPSYGGSGEDKLTLLIESRDVLVQTLSEKLARIYQLENEVESAMSVLDSEEELAIRLHYIEGKDWKIVAEEMKYSESSIYNFRESALKKLLL